MGIPFRDSPLLSLLPRTYFRWDSCWNFPVGASELITFVARSDRFCYSRSAEIPSLGFLLVFPRKGFTLIVCSQGTQFSPVGGLLFFSFLGELHQSSKWKIAYVPLDPVADYIHMLNQNNKETPCWLKNATQLKKFKLKFQTQSSNSNLNFKN